MALKISTLADNKALPGFESEWGFSLHIEEPGGDSWLWDAGLTDLFAKSADKLGVDLSRIRGVALSHGHYDHGDGLHALYDITGPDLPLYAHPDCFQVRYSIVAEDPEETHKISIKGMDSEMPRNCIPVEDAFALSHGLTMVTNIPRTPGLFEPVRNFFLDPEGKTPDKTMDDAMILAKTENGYSAILGCCHSGLGNTLNHLRDHFGVTELYSIMGGLHLYRATDDEIRETARFIDEFKTRKLYPGHCTADAPTQRLKELCRAEIKQMATGLIMSA